MRIFDWFIFIIVGKIKKPDECWFVFWNTTHAEVSSLFLQRNTVYDAWVLTRTMLRQLNSDADYAAENVWGIIIDLMLLFILGSSGSTTVTDLFSLLIQLARKRRVAIFKAQAKIPDAIKELNKYLEKWVCEIGFVCIYGNQSYNFIYEEWLKSF